LRDLPRLNADEAALFDDLRHKRLSFSQGKTTIRLEQERIGFEWVKSALAALELAPSAAARFSTESV